ncbi:MAG: PD40 domain-containing protein [Pyrinomonadaceae bacterium]|nr:PD40 domain-containing protein [Pyrinomonadaceae bacterium]
METETRHLYEFGDFCLDATERRLLRRGQPVQLTPKALETLLYLVNRSGRVVEKDELLRAVWPDTFVEEATLAQNIFTLRKALGQGRDTEQYIETIPKRGYRFIHSVRQLRDEGTTLVVEQHTRTHVVREEEETEDNPPGDEAHPDFHSSATRSRGDTHANRHAGELSAPEDDANSNSLWQQIKRHQTATLLGLLMPVLLLAAVTYKRYYRNNTEPVVAYTPAPFQRMRITKLTANGKASRATVSPDGKYLAHVIDDNGLQSLWVRQVAATNNVQIVAPAAVEYRGITFSHDGNHIYYVVYTKMTDPALLYEVPALGGTPRKLLEDVDSPVTLSPDGKRCAFIRGYPATRESALIVANLDGTGERRLATRKRPDYFSFDGPAWSPEGRLIACGAGGYDTAESYMNVVAFSLDDGSVKELSPQRWTWVGQVAWLGDGSGVLAIAWHLDGSVFADQIWHLSYPSGAARRVTNDLNGYRDISVSTDSKTLITIQNIRLSRIWIAPRGESERATQITSGFGDNYSEMFGMAWTPDGRILYASHASGNPDIWVMNADGSNQKQLTVDARTDYSPVASADGRYIVFVSNRNAGRHLWRMNADGSNPVQLTKGAGEEAPSLSPDGRWVVYSTISAGKPTLWRVPIEGGEAQQLTDEPSQRPVVSPDGKYIACVYQGKVAILPFEGGKPLRMFDTISLFSPQSIRWTADSRAITYFVQQRGVTNIWSQPVDGQQPKRLTNFKEDLIYRFAWSKDGRTLACERGTEINDIILVSDFN